MVRGLERFRKSGASLAVLFFGELLSMLLWYDIVIILFFHFRDSISPCPNSEARELLNFLMYCYFLFDSINSIPIPFLPNSMVNKLFTEWQFYLFSFLLTLLCFLFSHLLLRSALTFYHQNLILKAPTQLSHTHFKSTNQHPSALWERPQF